MLGCALKLERLTQLDDDLMRDCEAVFRGPDAKALSTVLLPYFQNLLFLQKPTTKTEFVFEELGGSTKQQIFGLKDRG